MGLITFKCPKKLTEPKVRVYMSHGQFDYCVSPSPKNWFFGFFRLGQDLGPVGTGDWGLGLGLDNMPRET